jgi:hypothetical protein
VNPFNQGATGSLMRKEDQGVIANITNTPKRIPIGDHTIAQVHPLLGNLRGLGWMI